MRTALPRSGGWQPFAAAALGASVDLLYLLLVASQGGRLGRPRVVFVAAFLGAVVLTVLGGRLVPDGRAQIALLTTATAGFVAFGVVALASIGGLLLVAGGLSGWGLTRVRAGVSRSVARAISICATVTVLAVLYAGMLVTR